MEPFLFRATDEHGSESDLPEGVLLDQWPVLRKNSAMKVGPEKRWPFSVVTSFR